MLPRLVIPDADRVAGFPVKCHFYIVICAVLAAGCTTAPDDGAGFYTWVDAQGNLVTVAREPQAAESAGAAVASAAETGGAETGVPSTATSENGQSSEAANSAPDVTESVASTPDELWQAGDDAYLPESEIMARLEQRERERFISYTDESGRLVTEPLDMAAVRESAATRDRGYEELAQDETSFTTGAIRINAGCCRAVLDEASLLGAGDEARLDFVPLLARTVQLAAAHPAAAYRLGEGVSSVQLQSWIAKGGYVHPQLLFVGADGVPLLLVDNVFSRRYRESFFSWPSLSGEVPVAPGAAWVVVFLPYVAVEEGRFVVLDVPVAGREQDLGLRIGPDSVIRAQ